MKKISYFLKIILLFIIFTTSSAKAKSDYFTEGKIFFDKKEFEKSKIFFERDIVFDPKSGRLLWQLFRSK